MIIDGNRLWTCPALLRAAKRSRGSQIFLAYSLIGSLALHIGVLTSALATLNKVPKIADEPIEGTIPIQDLKPKQEESAGSGTGHRQW